MSRPETGGNDDGQTEDDAESNSNLVTGFPATSVLYQLSSLLDTSKLYKNEQQLLLILSTVGLWRNTMQKKLKNPTPVQLPSGSWRCQVMINGQRISVVDQDPSVAHAKALALKAGIIHKVSLKPPDNVTT